MRAALMLIVALVAGFALAPARTHTAAGPALQAGCHLRVAFDEVRGGRAGMRWNVADTLNYDFAELTSRGQAADELVSDMRLEFTVGRCAGGRREGRSRYIVLTPAADGAVSLRLDASAAGARLGVGSRSLTEEQPVECALDVPEVRMQTYADAGVRVLRDTMTCLSLPALRMMDFASEGDLRAYLAASSDPAEGLWVYYDRDTDPMKSRPGGRYTLATVRANSHPGYDVYYLGGAAERAADWPCGRLKAELRPTTFADTYDLMWIQPDGLPVSGDTGAIIQGDMLTLQFPLYGATYRFSRAAFE